MAATAARRRRREPPEEPGQLLATPATPAVKMRQVADLVPYANNARIHSDGQIDRIVGSIREFGFTAPVLTADNDILAGHGRVLAAQRAGLAWVPTLDLSYLTPAQRRAYIIADNQIALDAGWDMDLLASELRELDAISFDTSLLGFADEDLEALLRPEPEPPAADPGDPADPAPARSSPRGTGNMVVQYNIIFDDVTQQQAWFGLLRRLKQQYPEYATVGARLVAYITAAEEAAGAA